MKTPEQRFWEKVDKNGPVVDDRDPLVDPRVIGTQCWVWIKALDGNGYGAFWLDGKVMRAHRASLIIAGVQLDEETDHLCRNHSCVRPLHLEPVTRAINTSRGRSNNALAIRDNTCKWGHPLVAENVYIELDTKARRCRVCINRSGRMKNARKRDGRLSPIEKKHLAERGTLRP